MRSIVILCLIAVTYARPDVSLGYKYNVASDGYSGEGTNLNGAALPLANTRNVNYQPNVGSSSRFINSSPQVQQASQQEPLISKQFFVHSAPEENEVQHRHIVLGRAQKNYRVVFIKAPSSSNANVRISAEYAPVQEKTHIFVLSKKEPELNVNDVATPAPTQPSKPEVFFVKYKTPEEARHAQQRIQEQYDSLGGTSQISDEGIAPVSSVIGSLGNNEELAPSSSDQQGVQIGNDYLPPKSNYLPPSDALN